MSYNVTDELAKLRRIAEAHDSYAYQFYYPDEFETHELLRGAESAPLVELRAFPDGSFAVTPVDAAGWPLTDIQPQATNKPNSLGAVGQPNDTSGFVFVPEDEHERLVRENEELRAAIATARDAGAVDVEAVEDHADERRGRLRRIFGV